MMPLQIHVVPTVYLENIIIMVSAHHVIQIALFALEVLKMIVLLAHLDFVYKELNVIQLALLDLHAIVKKFAPISVMILPNS